MIGKIEITVIVIILTITTGIVSFQYFTTPRGSVIGTFLAYETEDYGDYCGQYPYTRITMTNCTTEGENIVTGDELYFFGYHPELKNFHTGEKVKIDYHREARPSDTTFREMIFYWTIDSIKKV